jgi:mRNA-degrading endonuclease RelE of RelBE toxin-antitoxin system
MTSEPLVEIGYAPQFKRDLKHLGKKRRNVPQDVDELIRQLQQGQTPGNQIPGVGYPVYKVRLKSTALSRGKSGGFRVIYYIRTATRVILITIYAKSERADILPDEIRRIIEEYQDSL